MSRELPIDRIRKVGACNVGKELLPFGMVRNEEDEYDRRESEQYREKLKD